LKRLGILALQGDFDRHREYFRKSGALVQLIRHTEELDKVRGLVIPGGESTTIGKLMDRYGFISLLKEKIQKGFPVYGTCAGAILLAKEIKDSDQFRLGCMDIRAERNAYGRQVDSFETDIRGHSLGEEPLHCVFIRAPVLRPLPEAKGLEILVQYQDYPVLIRRLNMLAGSFHPELTDDQRVGDYFLSMIPES